MEKSVGTTMNGGWGSRGRGEARGFRAEKEGNRSAHERHRGKQRTQGGDTREREKEEHSERRRKRDGRGERERTNEEEIKYRATAIALI